METRNIGVSNLANLLHYEVAKSFSREVNIFLLGSDDSTNLALIEALTGISLTLGDEDSNELFIRIIPFAFTEKSINCRMNFFVASNFNTKIDRSRDLDAVLDFIESKNRQRFESETAREAKVKTGIDLCLYLLEESSGIQPIDMLNLLRLTKTVNILPLIANAQCYTPEELEVLKSAIISQWNSVNLPPLADKVIPFAIPSLTRLESASKKSYEWGHYQIDDPLLFDFMKLKSFLFSLKLYDILEASDKLFERYRITEMTSILNDSSRMQGLDDFFSRLNYLVLCHNQTMMLEIEYANALQLDTRLQQVENDLIAKNSDLITVKAQLETVQV